MNFSNFNSIIGFDFNSSSIEISPTVPPHFHNHYEIMYFQKGDAYYMVEGNNYEILEGDILLTNPRELHCPIFKSQKTYERSIVQIRSVYLSDFISENYSPFYALDKRKLGTQNRIHRDMVVKYGLDKEFETLDYYFYGDLPEKEVMLKVHSLQLLVAINNIVLRESKDVKSENIDKILHYINENLTKKITLNLLEEQFHLNKYHIAHSFKEKTGFTIMEYITQKRIIMAKELIIDGSTIGEAAEQVGFNDYSNFYRSFKKKMGYSPKKIK